MPTCGRVFATGLDGLGVKRVGGDAIDRFRAGRLASSGRGADGSWLDSDTRATWATRPGRWPNFW